jgi:hypothetical protein
MKVFVPFTEALCNEEMFERLGSAPGDLVPFQLEYEIFHIEKKVEECVEAIGSGQNSVHDHYRDQTEAQPALRQPA